MLVVNVNFDSRELKCLLEIIISLSGAQFFISIELLHFRFCNFKF